ncbi:MAG TPA: hypothetical protein VFX51_29100 [Solirubrobacteraceae bacterium]|nr:hypothetical protein [Solirubrobacteraceae bacterium]
MRRLVVLVVALLALAGAGCGSDENKTVAETEGLYLDINGLKYQVEMSRYMNANDVEDSEYLIGLPEGTEPPNKDETWFGVWVRVQNESGETLPAADTWEIVDTQDNVFKPIEIDTDINPFAFEKGVDVPANTVLPLASSAAGQGPIQGSLLLFKVTNESLQNRPLELRFSNGEGTTVGTYDLDV